MTRRWWARAALVAAGVTLAACGTSPQAHLDAGKACAAEGKYREAAIEFRSAVKGDPTLADAELRLAEAPLRSGSQEAALGAMERVATLMPANAEVQTRAGSLLLAGRLPEARARAEKALAIDPHRVDALVLRGNVLAGLADFDGPLSELQQALTLEPDVRRPHQSRHRCWPRRPSPVPAEAAFRKAISSAPKSATPHLALAHFLWSAGRLAEHRSRVPGRPRRRARASLALKGLGPFSVTTGRRPRRSRI